VKRHPGQAGIGVVRVDHQDFEVFPQGLPGQEGDHGTLAASAFSANRNLLAVKFLSKLNLDSPVLV
jgi:hypothetical protein